MPPDPAPFGRHVLAGGYATREQLQQARSLARQRDTDLMQALASVTEREPPAELVRQYQAYRLFELKVLYGVESLDPDVAGANAHSIEEALELGIPLQLCRQY
jgi:type IV pilus assembly protein PilB